MKKVKIAAKAGIVLQFMAGQTIEAIAHNGELFVPTGIPADGGTDEAPVTTSKKSAPASADDEEDESPKASASTSAFKKMTEEEMMEMDVKVLEKECIKRGIDPDATEGKNTNKKLRNLILDFQENDAPAKSTKKAAVADEEESEEAPKSRKVAAATSGGKADDVKDIFTDLENGEINEKKAVEKLEKLGIPKKAATGVVEDFMADAETPVSTFIKKAAALITDDESEEEEEEEAPKSRRGAKTEEAAPAKKGKKKTVEIDELEVGDRVEVLWEDHDSFFTGTVKSIGRKGVLVAYDDNTEDYLDADNNTEINLI